MRTPRKNWSALRGAFVFSANNMEVLGISADFSGGFVIASGVVSAAAPGAGGWVGLLFQVDGVNMGQTSLGNYQATGASNIGVEQAVRLRVPQGRHRVSLLMTSGSAPGFNISGAYLDLTEI